MRFKLLFKVVNFRYIVWDIKKKTISYVIMLFFKHFQTMLFYHKSFVLNFFSILFKKEQNNIWQSYFVLYLVSFAKYVLKKWEKAGSSNWTGIGM